jgi:hypothetical protein
VLTFSTTDFNLHLKYQAITAQKFWRMHCDVDGQGQVCMLKISVVEGPDQRRLILEGKLIVPWVAELTAACETARANLDGRELIVDVTSLTAIGPEGESVLLRLMNEKTKFQCGVFMKEVLKQLAQRRLRASEHPNE